MAVLYCTLWMVSKTHATFSTKLWEPKPIMTCLHAFSHTCICFEFWLNSDRLIVIACNWFLFYNTQLITTLLLWLDKWKTFSIKKKQLKDSTSFCYIHLCIHAAHLRTVQKTWCLLMYKVMFTMLRVLWLCGKSRSYQWLLESKRKIGVQNYPFSEV